MPIENSVSVEAGSTRVDGYLTQFVAAEGDTIIINGISALVQQRDSTSQITLKRPWPGSSVVESVNWDLVKTGPSWSSTVTVNSKITELIGKIENGLPFDVDGAGSLAKRDTYNTQGEGFVFVQTDVAPALVFIKTGPGPTEWSAGLRIQADQAQSTIDAIAAAEAADASKVMASEWAMTTGRVVINTTEYSAKEYSVGTFVPTGSAKSWATKATSEVVTGQGYSAKEYAVGTGSAQGGSAKDWATKTGSVVVTGSYSAKEYAQGTTSGTGGSALSWATRTGSVIPGTSEYSAKEYAQGTTAAMGGSSKDWAQKTGAVVGDTTEYSAKEYAVGTTVPAGSAKKWATDAATSAANFKNTYYGPLAADPTTRPDSTPIQEGDTYTRTTAPKGLKVYSAGAWVASAIDAAALNAKADVNSPAFTGNPTAPTPVAGDNDTSIATTAFVTTALGNAFGNNSVTNAKLSDMATGTLKGRVSAGTGAPEDLTAAQLRDNFFPAGSVINSVAASYTANADLTTIIPIDDTIPQNTEGTQILSLSITPSSASSKIRLRFFGSVTCAVVRNATLALFRSGNVNAIHAASGTVGGAGYLLPLSFEAEDSPATTSAVTYTVRIGPDAANALRFNGNSSQRLLGGAAKAVLIAEEIKA